MKQMINTTDYAFDVERYRDEADAISFAGNLGMDGFELLPCEGGRDDFFTERSVVGVHLRYFDSWLDFWNGKLEMLSKEYGSFEKVKEIFGGLDRSCILKRFREDLERARKLKARYVVFHVSDVSARELFTYQCRHTDEEVIDAAAELINLLLDGENYTFDFLMENLWWPGLTMTRPEMTKRLLSQVHYQKKGIMLDTGHLMHMNLELKTQEEAVDYILEKVAEHGNLASYIKGMHLNQSITGAYVKTLITKKDAMPSDYEACSKACYEHVFQIDQHLPFTTPKVQKLVETIKPEYLTHELMSYGKIYNNHSGFARDSFLKREKLSNTNQKKARQLCYNDHKLVDSNIKYKVTTAFADSERQVTDYFLGEEKYVFRDQRLEKIIWHSRKQDGSAERN